MARIDIQGLKIFEIGEKFYFEDLGVRYAIRGFDPLTEGLITDPRHCQPKGIIVILLQQRPSGMRHL